MHCFRAWARWLAVVLVMLPYEARPQRGGGDATRGDRGPRGPLARSARAARAGESSRRRLRRAFGIYLLYMAPVILSGGWTWTGYNFVNDGRRCRCCSAEHLRLDGLTEPPGDDTTGMVVRTSL